MNLIKSLQADYYKQTVVETEDTDGFKFLLSYFSFPDSSVWKRINLQCRRLRFNSRVEKIAGEGTDYPLQHSWASLVAQLVKNTPALRET